MKIILLFLVFTSCQQLPVQTPETLVNSAHLDHLYEEIVLDSLPAAFIYIYAEAPDYRPVVALGEGITCVDDAARAAVFYLRHHQFTGNNSSLEKSRKLLQFLLDMQAANGLFYNFIYGDHSINKTHRNSEARADWWTWRALWAMAEAYPHYQKIDNDFAEKLNQSINKILPAIDSLLAEYPDTSQITGFVKPSWIPYDGAADQTGVMLLGLTPYFRATKDPAIARQVELLTKGILRMQISDPASFADGAFLSWENIWHAWGNSQAEAVLRASAIFEQAQWQARALKEVRQFYPYLIKENFIRQLNFMKEKGAISPQETIKFEQIAYDIRPMVMASLAAYEITGDETFARQAGEIACWLLGSNVTGRPLYDPGTGRCFDGIIAANEINQNSGAESTIEALLTLLAVEQNAVARKVVHDYYQSREKNER